MNDDIEYIKSKVNDASQWSNKSGRVIITPNIESLDELETKWIQFNSMIKKHRRESDWKSIELFGCTNQDQYEDQRKQFLKLDIEISDDEALYNNLISESCIDLIYSDVDMTLNYTNSDIEKAKEWSDSTNKIIIVPTRNLAELEDLWDAYNSMIKKHKRESDWMSEELFGLSNLQHYTFLKNNFLRNNLDVDNNSFGNIIESISTPNIAKYMRSALHDSYIETSKLLLEHSIVSNNVYDNEITSNVVSDVMDKYDSDVTGNIVSDDIEFISGAIPYISSDDMVDMGVLSKSPDENYYGYLSDNTELSNRFDTRKWFNSYLEIDNEGSIYEFVAQSTAWKNRLKVSMYELNLLNRDGTSDDIKVKKQSILEMGWDPDVEFNDKSEEVARQFAMNKFFGDCNNTYKFVDLRDLVKNVNIEHGILESGHSPYKAVYIILVEGKSYISNTIKTITKDIYSHSAISLDPSLEYMYSYGISKSGVGGKSGFRRESINDLKGCRIHVFAFFVSDRIFDKIKENLDMYKNNTDRASYSYLNLITYLFNIEYNKEWKLICSQFVDRCLQHAGIDIIKKDPSLVSPSDNNKIYSLYEGVSYKYDAKRIEKVVNSLSTKAKAIKEASLIQNQILLVHEIINNIYNINKLIELSVYKDDIKDKTVKKITDNLFESVTISPILCEAKEFPVQFDADGNMFIKNIKRLNYNEEYAKCHKLLKQYLIGKNYEGIKYELSKLWMMLCIIEKKLNTKHMSDERIKEMHDSKARITNDFKYYLNEVIKVDKEFNFTEYFNNTPFSDIAIKINNTSLSFISKMIKKFISPI